MARITTYLGSHSKTGEHGTLEINIPLVGWSEVGKGTWTKVSDYSLVYDGKIDIAGVVDSSVDLSVALTDQSSSASSGPAHVVINGSGSDGSYKVDGEKLLVQFKSGGDNVKLKLYRVDDGEHTGVNIDGTDSYDGTLHIT